MYVKCIRSISSLLQPGILRMCGDMVQQTAEGGRVLLWESKTTKCMFLYLSR